MSRKYRQFVARLLLAAFVFAQGAVSSYACPGMTGPLDAPPAAEAMPDCDEMTGLDPSAPNLCLAHCQAGHQTFDHSAQPSVALADLGALVVSLTDPAISAETSIRASKTQRFTAAAPPPHTILHCCFRI